jgi:hypothetical protein
MVVAVIGLAAVFLGLVCVMGDERIGRRAPRGPEVGAALSRALGLILLVGGGLLFLGTGR